MSKCIVVILQVSEGQIYTYLQQKGYQVQWFTQADSEGGFWGIIYHCFYYGSSESNLMYVAYLFIEILPPGIFSDFTNLCPAPSVALFYISNILQTFLCGLKFIKFLNFLTRIMVVGFQLTGLSKICRILNE
jgi:hypothetical protein